MSFKAVITEEYTEMNGTGADKLTGLSCYIDALIEQGIPEFLIKGVIDMTFADNKKESNKKIETILDKDNIKIQKIDLNNVTKEEAKKIIDEEILKKMFD